MTHFIPKHHPTTTAIVGKTFGTTSYLPKRHHLDKRAAQAADHKLAQGGPDDMLRTKVVAEWLGVSESWLANGRSKGYGPRWIRISPSVIAYRRSDVLAWLDGRTHQSTAEYQD